ncbi:MAG: hypothetical protein AAFY60_06860 [Myxococcota bacterium]
MGHGLGFDEDAIGFGAPAVGIALPPLGCNEGGTDDDAREVLKSVLGNAALGPEEGEMYSGKIAELGFALYDKAGAGLENKEAGSRLGPCDGRGCSFSFRPNPSATVGSALGSAADA